MWTFFCFTHLLHVIMLLAQKEGGLEQPKVLRQHFASKFVTMIAMEN